MSQLPSTPDKGSTPVRFGPVELAPGVLPRHVTSFIVAALIAISLTIFVNMLQPYVLTEHLRLSSSTHGRISSGLVVMQETIALLLVGFLGAFGFCGSIGVLVVTIFAGQLFDRWTHAGPFILVGSVNLAVFAWAWLTRHRLAFPAGVQHR